MTFLLRTGVGRYPLTEAFTLEEIAAAPEKVLLPPETAVAHIPLLAVNPLQAYRITGGVRTTIKGTAEGTYRLYCGSEFLGLVQAVEEIVQPLKILQQTAKPAETGTEM